MKKSNMLLIGCGKAGNKLVNEMMNANSIYSGLFVNTSYNDMANLNNFKEERAFLFDAANGSGRNRELSKEYVKGQIKALVTKINEYPLSKNIVIFTSSDGGSGSGMTPLLIQLLAQSFKMAKKQRSINLVAIIPDFNTDDKIAFENSLSFWNEIDDVKSCLNDIKFVDNSKGSSYADINARVVTALNNSYTMNGQHDEGDIDDMDSEIFNTAKGFGLVLTLEKGFKTAKEAIDNAIKNSIFALPNSYDCDYLGISLMEDDYSISDVRNCFENVYNTTYKTYNKRHNTIVLAGTDEPSESMELIKARLDELKERENSRKNNRTKTSLKIDLEAPVNNKPKKTEQLVMTEDELDDIADALEKMFG